MDESQESSDYLHGYTDAEQGRLLRQARITEDLVHEGLSFPGSVDLLEVGCGVGAQTAILLRRHPALHITGIDASRSNLAAAAGYLATQPDAAERFTLVQGNAAELEFEDRRFDSAFLCFVLEHLADPLQVLCEVRRVLRPGSPVVCTEVQNETFRLSPPCSATLSYWGAYNDLQRELGGDPNVGAKLGDLLLRAGFRDVRSEALTVHLDGGQPAARAAFLDYWTELLGSAAPALLRAGRTGAAEVAAMQRELAALAEDPQGVFFYAGVRAWARVD